jgi:hypothetical protein
VSCETLWSQDAQFSGPQPGERLPLLTIRLVLNEHEGEQFDPIAASPQGANVILFVHEVTRPSIALTRLVANYASRFADQGLRCTVVLLTSDPTEMQAFVQRAKHALPTNVTIGISSEGIEGPGAYGLNRKMTLTVLLGKEGRVTDNFALIQPSLAADAPRIGTAVHALMGSDHRPDLAEMGLDATEGTQRMNDGSFRRLLAPVIDRAATAEQVAKAAEAVEARAAEDSQFRQRLGEATQRIVSAGVVENYGTPAARQFLLKWAKQYGAGETTRQSPNGISSN